MRSQSLLNEVFFPTSRSNSRPSNLQQSQSLLNEVFFPTEPSGDNEEVKHVAIPSK